MQITVHACYEHQAEYGTITWESSAPCPVCTATSLGKRITETALRIEARLKQSR